MNSLKISGILGVRLDLFSDAPDIHVHASRCYCPIISPHTVEQLISGKDHSRMTRQIVEQPEFQRAKFHGAAADADTVSHRVDGDLATLHLRSLRAGGLVPPQKRPDPRDQFTR